MKVRREMAASQMWQAIKFLRQWAEQLEQEPLRRITDGLGQVTEERIEKLPDGMAVVEFIGEEGSAKLRAELTAIAVMLEGLAST